MELVRKVYPLSRLPIQSNRDIYRDEGHIILLPPLDFANWIAWREGGDPDSLIAARIRHIETGLETYAVVGCAELEDDQYGEIYATTYLIHMLGINDTSTALVKISPWTKEIPKGTFMKVQHNNTLVNELGLNVFERLQETIMDWPLIQKGGEVTLVFPEAGDLIVCVNVIELEPADVVRLGGELHLEIDGPEPEPEPAATATPEPEPEPEPEPAAAAPQLTPEERRRLIRESWAKKYN